MKSKKNMVKLFFVRFIDTNSDTLKIYGFSIHCINISAREYTRPRHSNASVLHEPIHSVFLSLILLFPHQMDF